MNDRKVDIDLTGVPQTLLMPLFGRALFSQESYSPLHDQKAIGLVKSINYDFETLHKKINRSVLFWMARAYHFDNAIKKFLEKHPQATIVNLGAGLDTAFYRIDNQQLTWIDLDFPEVISLREKLSLNATDRYHYIAKSVLDYSWMDEVKKYSDKIFFLAGGLFIYFTEEQVKSLLVTMAGNFPDAELIFDSVSTRGIYYANKMLSGAKMTNAQLQWGLDDASVLESWSKKIKVINSMPYFKGIKCMPGFPIKFRLRMFHNDFFAGNGIVQLRFGLK